MLFRPDSPADAPETTMEKPKPLECDLSEFLNEHLALPPLPECVMKLQEVIREPSVSIETVCRILVKEPALTANVLRTVNSAYYGFRREVDDIKFATAYLGIHEIYNMALAFSVVKTLGITDAAELDRFWNHSVLTAICAKHLARRFEPLLSPDQIWLGGLLHDIGKLAYLVVFPDHYREIQLHRQENGCLFSQSERHFSYPSSSDIGAFLCDRWRLPVIIRDACEGHRLEDLNRPTEGSRGDFRRIVCAANLMAVLVGDGMNNEVKQSIFDALQTRFNLDEREFLKLMGEVYDLKLDLAKYEW
jgi:HD-like signal output (HDOD) protein